MRKNKYFEALSENLQAKADKKAGYPPNCNEGYVAKDGKCVPVEKDAEAEHKSDDMKEGGQVCPKGQAWDKKAKKCVPVDKDAGASAEESEFTVAPAGCPECYNKGGSVCKNGQVWDEKAGKCIPCPGCAKKDSEKKGEC